jgi:nucleoid-associated protein YgaU
MSRTVFWLVGGGVIVIAVALAVAWRGKLTEQAVMELATKPAAVAPPAAASTASPMAAPTAPASAQTAPATAAPTASAGSPTAAPTAVPGPQLAPVPPAAVIMPSFDVARISPEGRAVIAGRAAPGAKVVLLDGGKEIASSAADTRGEWVMLVQEPPLSPGQHELRVIQHIEGRAPVTSEQVAIVVVPQPPAAGATTPKEETLVVISPRAGAATLVQPPSAAGVPKSADLVISTVDYDDRGHATISGQATPGTTVRAYLDDKMVAEGIAGPDGRWRLAPTNPLDHGKHKLRVDRLAPDGKPVARLELPFERVAMPPPAGGEGKRLYVVQGDNLWNIARVHYGDGWRHTTIFNANKEQIRNPHLIYPGQVFSLPKAE